MLSHIYLISDHGVEWWTSGEDVEISITQSQATVARFNYRRRVQGLRQLAGLRVVQEKIV